MRITVLVENETSSRELRSEHGLALWIETGDHRILFDTGASDAIVANANVLGIDLASADVIVLSHGHHDHTGGLASVARVAGGAAIYAGTDVSVPKYSRRESGLHEIGLDHQVMNAVAHRLRTAEDGHQLVPGVTVLAGFPDSAPLPADNKRLLVRGAEGMIPDPFIDEIALLFVTGTGPVLVSGCSHRGIGNIVRKAVDAAGPLAAIIGGFHLNKETDEDIRRTATFLEGIPRVHAAHCTGSHAVDVLREALGPAVLPFRTGSVMEIT